jgi:hypothetical protein
MRKNPEFLVRGCRFDRSSPPGPHTRQREGSLAQGLAGNRPRISCLPPSSARDSTNATFLPIAAAVVAPTTPAGPPPPITIRSNSSVFWLI